MSQIENATRSLALPSDAAFRCTQLLLADTSRISTKKALHFEPGHSESIYVSEKCLFCDSALSTDLN